MARFRVMAIILALISLFMLPSLFMAIILGEASMLKGFLIPLAISLSLAVFAIFIIPRKKLNLHARDGFMLVFLSWVLSSIVGSLPYYFSPLDISFYDSIFESVCCFTTTGVTVLGEPELLPRSLLLWRSMSHWAGGMGIILLSVALMPILGIGGFQLVKAEAPGPDREKITPRITETAKILWGVYCALTFALTLLYRIAGMEWFDAVCHAFTIMATGGVSTKNSGFAFYDSAFIDWITVVFMLLAALNFSLYFRIIRGNIRDLVQNTECRVYFAIFAAAALLITFSLVPHYGSFGEALRFGSFEAAAFLSTAGNARNDYTVWPALAQAVLFCLMFTGGCSGSTAGGIKVIRLTVLFKQAVVELRRTIYPSGVFSIRINKKVLHEDSVRAVSGFIFLYAMVVAVATTVTAAAGFDIFSSFHAALSFTGNFGTGFAFADFHYANNLIPGYLKLFYSLVMIAGRLELWTVFILFTPEYWKR